MLEWFNMHRNADLSYQQPYFKHTGKKIDICQQIKKQQVNGQKVCCWKKKNSNLQLVD